MAAPDPAADRDTRTGRTGRTDKTGFYRDARRDVPGPCAGIRVLDLTTAWAGPMATCILGDLGCDVVRVELPGSRDGQVPPSLPGTGRSWFRETVNRNKRSLTLDVRRPDGVRAFLQLVATADVVVENFRPCVLDAWGVGYRACRAARPGIVFVSVSGWGQFGPYAERPGYDPVTQAASGWLAANGASDGPPARAPTFLADDLGGLHAAIGALAALRHRDRTGEGQHVDVSLQDALLFHSGGQLTLAAAGLPPRRWGNELESIVPANLYHCTDGSVYLAVALNRHWRALARAMGRQDLARAPGFATNDERCANRATVDELVAGWCRSRSTATVLEELRAASLAVARVATFEEVVDDPHVQARDILQPVRLGDGTTVRLVGPAVKFSRTPTRIRAPAPDPGEHTDEVLRSLGLDPPAPATPAAPTG